MIKTHLHLNYTRKSQTGKREEEQTTPAHDSRMLLVYLQQKLENKQRLHNEGVVALS